MPPFNLDPDFTAAAFPELRSYLEALLSGGERIAPKRQKEIQAVSRFAAEEIKVGREVKLIFICTHNSRRSHFGQVWAATAAEAFGLPGITTYSGGTAATAFNPRAATALERAGFRVQRPEGRNPPYEVAWSGRRPAMICFSKIYDDPSNPHTGFAAVMTCSEADHSCPLIPGATARFSLPYEDPKSADGTERETARYDERCRQIATEMLFLFQQVREAR
ncbi:MAG: protein-tyrosine-phosphatase [Bacteroidota bacterium]